jgi:hypothetical protein
MLQTGKAFTVFAWTSSSHRIAAEPDKAASGST